ATAAATDADAIAATTVRPPDSTTEPTAPGEPGWLSMRTAPRAIAPVLDPSRVHLTVAPPDPSKPPYEPPEPTGLLRPDGGGSFRTDETGFVARVDPDGHVSFDDRPSAHAQINLPRPHRIARAIGQGLERWYADPGAALRAGEANPDEARDLTATEKEKPQYGNPEAVILPIVSGGFDATDAIMRAHGMDPYAAAKLKWMDATREERTQLMRAHRLIELGKSTQSMRRNLARLWRRPGLDDAARKAALFQLWDDCADDGDAAVEAACGRVRAEVIAFVRTHLPAGSPSAYTADELAALNAHRVTKAMAFAPYD
ncbi:MAG TPA: hypothetical protein VHE35_16150, partial [Kofleriaceae bacterium]|nr:hypothetical protein [Kofleriaceae bacterium]